MLPNPHPNGLPSGPASRLAARARQDQTLYTRKYTSTDSSSRGIRSQHSLPSLTPSREPRSPTEPLSRFPRADSTRVDDREARHPRQSNGYSTSSEASSASSFFDRMRGDRVRYKSSRTSLEEDPESPNRVHHDTKSLRKRGVKEPPQSYEDDGHPALTAGEGYSLWNQVVSLSVDVSKAWAANLATFNGEETPTGQESRLTRAMKAYHLEKARDPSDLPAWLFEDHERRSVHPQLKGGHRDNDTEYDRPQSPPRSRGLRDVYDASVTSSAERAPASNRFDEGARLVKTTNRLKELRDAKRSAGLAPTPHDNPSFDTEGRRDGGRTRPVGDMSRRPPPVGLPMRPIASGLTPVRI